MDDGYRVALLDWLACAVGGCNEPASRAARALGDGLEARVAALGTAGHVLDFDDTYAPGLAHLSAPTAPAALVLGAELGATVGDVLTAYAEGFEAMAVMAAANHPGLRERGWHPTAVCGVIGAAIAAARLLGLGEDRREHAIRLSLLRAGGLQAAFGSDGKSLQVGLAAAAGVTAARLAAAGATASDEVVAGFEAAFGATEVPVASLQPRKEVPVTSLQPRNEVPGTSVRLRNGCAVASNWIKAWPCCLQTQSAIEAAAGLDGVPEGSIAVVVHPVSRLTAFRDDVETGLEAKFSIPYLVAHTLLHGPPDVAALSGAADAAARGLARERIAVRVDDALRESEARIEVDGEEVARVEAAVGSPERPMDGTALAAKVRSLAGDRLDGALGDLAAPAAELLSRTGADRS